MKGEIAARKEGISYNEYQNRISRAMGYGCGSYCGDLFLFIIIDLFSWKYWFVKIGASLSLNY